MNETLFNSKKMIRRSKSNCTMTDLIKQELDYKTNSPDKPLHESVESYFSTSSGFNNFRGLLNLGIILLVVSNFRVALENIIKYGILIRPIAWLEFIFQDPHQWPCIMLLILSNIFILTILVTEILLEKHRLTNRNGIIVQISTLISMLVYSSYVVLIYHPSPIVSAPVLGIYTVLFLKLWSYVHVNKWCRDGRRNRLSVKQHKYDIRLSNGYQYQSGLDLANDDSGNGYNFADCNDMALSKLTVRNLQRYPDNLNLKDLYYFVVAPTLCYELNFPRTLNIRKRFLLKRILELVFMPLIILSLIQQWILPLLHNSVVPFSQSRLSVIVERMLKLSIPNHLIWLMFFYVMFHSGLNVCAELLRFGDRLFYKDWWNAMSVTEFWSTWNVPVHRWARRHVFIPLLQRKYSKFSASVLVFFISAFFHEFLVSVPLRMFRLWAFSAMLGQVPFSIFVSRYLKGTQFGNFAVWISLIIGQPLAMMMYFHDYYVQNMMP